MKDGLAQDLFEYEKCIEMHNSGQIIPPVLSKGFDPVSPSRFRDLSHTTKPKGSYCWPIPWIVFGLGLA